MTFCLKERATDRGIPLDCLGNVAASFGIDRETWWARLAMKCSPVFRPVTDLEKKKRTFCRHTSEIVGVAI